MRTSQHTFVGCHVEVAAATEPDPEKPGESIRVTLLVISNPHQAETYVLPMQEELRVELIRKLTGGVQMASSLREVRS